MNNSVIEPETVIQQFLPEAQSMLSEFLENMAAHHLNTLEDFHKEGEKLARAIKKHSS